MNSIAKSGLGALAMICLGSAALAADMPAPAMAPVMVPTFSWTGFYIGGQVGNEWGRDRTTEYLTATGQFTGMAWKYSFNGGVYGAHAGANYQFGSLLIGAEADIEGLTDSKGRFVDPGGRGDATKRWQGSLRARLGYTFDRINIYATGGFAYGDIRYVYTNPLGAFETSTGVRTGYTLGGGVEYAFTDALIGRIEYRYTDFGAFRYTATSAFLGLTGRQQPRFDSVRVGVSYKF